MLLNNQVNRPDASCSVESNQLNTLRRRRLMQISAVSAMGVFVSLLLSHGITLVIFSLGLTALLVAFYLSHVALIQYSAYLLLASMSAMLFALALTGAGLFDIAILGYPALIMFAALLGGVRLFWSVLATVIGLCLLLGWFILSGQFTPNIPVLSWRHVLFLMIIFLITGFSVYVMVRDITGLNNSLENEFAKSMASQKRIEYLAHHDPLTELPNRLYAQTLFEQLSAHCQREHHQLAVLFIDLDNFKPVNDALGHDAGDELLRQLAERIKRVLHSDQHMVRFGGDEFIVLSSFLDEHGLKTLANRLLLECASIFDVLENQIIISASIGIAKTPTDGNDFIQLCRKADIAMYKAKKNGSNSFCFYDEDLDTAKKHWFNTLQRMRPAIKEQQFELYYQPIVSLSDGSVQKAEALLRWPQTDGTMLSPLEFIPIAESTGLINPLGEWVLYQACQFCAAQRRSGMPSLCVSVNISVVQFASGDLPNIVSQALERANLPPTALELELTESSLVEDKEKIKAKIDRIVALGVSIAIDDFGSGYSNLSYLRSFNATTLKIDRSFICSLCSNEHNARLVKAMVNMAESLGLLTVAEGIEDLQTLQQLIAIGCTTGQGYFWSEPVPKDVFATRFNKHSA